MNPLLHQVVESWQVNNRVNVMIIRELSPELLALSLSKKGGRSIGGQFAHIHAVRLKWLEVGMPALYKTQESFDKNELPAADKLISRLNASADAIADWLTNGTDENGKLKGYKKGPVNLMSYLISHEAHHRGNILLTLKQNGFAMPDSLKWGMWDWTKI